MRAIRLKAPGGLDNLAVAEAELAPLGPHDIHVRLHASSLNYHDYVVVLGGIPCEDGRIPMSDGAGVVVAVGGAVHDFVPGDHVISTFFPRWIEGEPDIAKFFEVPGDRSDGYARAEVVAPATAFTRAPRGYSHTEAATLPCAALTAWRALHVEAALQPGETVLVQGTGGVSIFALQFAKATGATVIATSSSDAKLERLRAMGADHLINYKTDTHWGATARALTGGRGVDHIVEVGGPGTLAQSIMACRMRGNISLIGVLTGFAGDVPTAAAMSGNVRITGITVGSRAQQQAMVAAIDATGIRPVIDSVHPLEAIADAFRLQASQTHFGKICLAW
ncbi:NADPH:quinone oxidoreductase [alpha proteobacterium AAP81b]|nr:NADPH:quinone oxidoreductase [alpha proteobacterium AAP81b]